MAYNGGVGYVDTGTMPAPPSGFERHSAALSILRHCGASHEGRGMNVLEKFRDALALVLAPIEAPTRPC